MKFLRHFILLKQYITKNGEAIRLASSVNVIIFTRISIFFLLFYIPVSKAISHNLYIHETNFRQSTQNGLYTRRFVSLYYFQKYKLILMNHYKIFHAVITYLFGLTFYQKYVSIKISQKRPIQITQSHISLGR